MQIEYRTAELRAATAAFEVAGRAASYNQLSNDLGGFKEKLLPGVFSRSLASNEQDVKCLVNHDSNQVLGRRANKTLTLSDTPEGLNFTCKLNKDSQAHRDLYASVKRGDLSECSFAFIVDGDDGQSFSDKNGQVIRTIKRAKLLDVSVVASPAYGNGATTVDARAAAPSIGAQIRDWNKRHPNTKQVIAEARFRASEYPELSFETIARGLRLGYSEDTFLQLRFAAITEQLRQGGGLEPLPMRYEQGQSADPTASLRADDDHDFDWDDEWFDRSEHERAAKFHRGRASKASLERACSEYKCADLHDQAARLYPDRDASAAARAASKTLVG